MRRYLERADEFPRRAEGESVLLAHVAPGVRRVLDLGTGDGRLLALLRRERPHLHGVGLDASDVMLDAARARFQREQHIGLVEHGMVRPLPHLGRFDAVVSSMAIHHLEHEHKRELYAEVFELLEHEDPSDRLLDVETQLAYLREAGFTDVDCYWKWLEMAVLIGVRPPAS